jgi:hypothetical protein
MHGLKEDAWEYDTAFIQVLTLYYGRQLERFMGYISMPEAKNLGCRVPCVLRTFVIRH